MGNLSSNPQLLTPTHILRPEIRMKEEFVGGREDFRKVLGLIASITKGIRNLCSQFTEVANQELHISVLRIPAARKSGRTIGHCRDRPTLRS